MDIYSFYAFLSYSQNKFRYMFGLSANVGLLMLLDKDPRARQWRCLTSTQVWNWLANIRIHICIKAMLNVWNTKGFFNHANASRFYILFLVWLLMLNLGFHAECSFDSFFCWGFECNFFAWFVKHGFSLGILAHIVPWNSAQALCHLIVLSPVHCRFLYDWFPIQICKVYSSIL